MFRFVAVHDHPSFCLQFPCSLVDIEYNHVHTEVQSRFLGAQAGTEAGVEKDEQQGFIFSQFLIGKGVLFYELRLFQRLFQVAYILYGSKMLHMVLCCVDLIWFLLHALTPLAVLSGNDPPQPSQLKGEAAVASHYFWLRQ